MTDENAHEQTPAASGEASTGQTTSGQTEAGDSAQTAGTGAGTGAPVSLKDAVTKALSEDEDAPLPQPKGDEGGDEADEGEGGDSDEAAATTDGADGNADAADPNADPELVAPEGISTKARERFDTLVERVKQSDQRYVELDSKFKGIEATLKGTGATPEQWGRVLTAMRYGNSGDPAQARQALEILDGYRAEIAAIAGVPVQGVDVLADFPDLRTSVDNGDLDEKFAAELAASRRAQARNRTQTNERQANEQAATQLQQRQESAKSALDKLGSSLSQKDVDYPRKLEILQKRGVIDNIATTVPPEQWQASFQAAYDALSDVASSFRAPAPKPGEQPMRRSGKSGSGSEAKPKSIEEAVRMAIAED